MCKATIASSGDKPTAEEKDAEKKAILKLGPLLKTFTLAGSLKHEMEVMFEAQKLCEKTGHKSGAPCPQSYDPSPSRCVMLQ